MKKSKKFESKIPTIGKKKNMTSVEPQNDEDDTTISQCKCFFQTFQLIIELGQTQRRSRRSRKARKAQIEHEIIKPHDGAEVKGMTLIANHLIDFVSSSLIASSYFFTLISISMLIWF